MALELKFTIPGQIERTIPVDQADMKIGALLSNQVVLRAPGVDPIHALIEENGEGNLVITDLGSATGVKVNGLLVDVEHVLKAGDSVTIGSVNLTVIPAPAAALAAPGITAPPPPPPGELPRTPAPKSNPKGATVRVDANDEMQRRQGTNPTAAPSETEAAAAERKKNMLFSPRHARPSGDVLEVVAYWGDTVLDVELFHPSYKGFDTVTIGDPTKAHLIAAGKAHFDRHTLATIKGDGFKLNLIEGMHARLRKGGKVEKVEGKESVSLGNRDIAHLRYGAVSYFLMFVKPPSVVLPRSGPSDPFFAGLLAMMALFWFALIPYAVMYDPQPKADEKDDEPGMIVYVPEKDKKPEPEKKPEVKKPEVKIAEIKTPPKTPPKPQPKPPVKPAPPVEKEKVVQTKPVEKPVPEKKPTTVLTDNKTDTKSTNNTPTPQTEQQKTDKPPGPLSKLNGTGMPSTGAKSPDFKLAGPKLANTALGKSGGVVGSGMNQQGAPIKGKGKADYMGVEGVNNNKASGVNLSKLSVGVGKIMDKTGAGAISTNFKSSGGGLGGGMGSASKTYGLGGVGSGKSLGLAGSGGAVNNFGSGSGGLLSGQGGSGGAGGAGLAGAFGGGGGKGGHGRANVTVPAGDPVVSGGLTPQEIMAVIRANLNQIRHCYEQLLQRSPNASGKMAVNFVINASGRIQSVSVTDSTISDSMMRGCVTGKINRWAFPKPRGSSSVTVNYPFVFNPL